MSTPLLRPDGRQVRIVLDFDGTLAHDNGMDDPCAEAGAPIEGAKEFVEWLLTKGYAVTIMSARVRDGGLPAIQAFIAKYQFPELPITGEKPRANLYVDDRSAPRFEGDFTILKMFLINHPVPGRWETDGPYSK